MKFSHIIYNSSEKNRSGGVGFGVRSATASTPPQLISAMEQNGIFSFKESNVALSPSALFENPDLIKQTAPSYFFNVVSLPNQAKGYVIGRKIAVGFDYTFYLNGRPGRLGNYVVDSYVFQECPTADAFEILLESPAPGSLRFIPADPSPRESNDEMRGISVGHHPDLEEEDGSFKAIGAPTIDDATVALLFSFIQSRKCNKPLLVKAAPEEAPRLMAGLAQLLPQASIPDMTFVTNHNEQGVRAGINICFISPSYRFEIFPNVWVVLDLNARQRHDTQECAMFAPMVEQYLRAGELQKVRAIAAWCLSPVYEASKSASPATQKALFAFIHDFNAFDDRLIASDAKLRELVVGFLKQAPEYKLKLEHRMQERISCIDHYNDLKLWIDYIRKIRPIDLSGLVGQNKKHINDLIFDDSKSFLSFYESYKDIWPEIVREYVDPDRFRLKSYYISNFNSAQWEALYPYFLKEILDAKETDKLILRMFDDNVDRSARQRIINKEIPDKRRQAEALCTILASSPGGYTGLLIDMLVDVSRELKSCPVDCFKILEAHLDKPVYASLFACSLELSDFSSVEAIWLFIEGTKAFLLNPKGSDWLKGRGGQEAFTRLFAALVTGIKSGSIGREEAKGICEEIVALSVSPNIRQKFSHLSRIMQRSTFYGDDEVQTLWVLAAELGDKVYLTILAPDFLKYVECDDVNLIQRESPGYPDGFVAYLIKESILPEDEVLAIASKSVYCKYYWLALMRMKGGKPQEEYDFLTQKARMSDVQALAFLDKYSPDSYRKIVKSRQPSVWSKISGGLKGMFSKKDKTGDDSRKGGDDGGANGASRRPRGPQVPHGAPDGGARNAASYSDGRPESYSPSQNRRRR